MHSHQRTCLLYPAVLLLAALAPSASANLLIYYPLNETAGNIAGDAALGNGAQDAASVSIADWQSTSGILGGAIRFSPTAQSDTNEALVYNSGGSPILSTTPFTLTCWIQTTNAGAFNRAAIFLGDGTMGSSYYALGMDPTNKGQQVARNTTAINNIGSVNINDGLWHQLTAVFASNTSRQLYVDGKLTGSGASTSVPLPNLNRFAIGSLYRSAPTDAYSGLLDEVGAFDTAASAAQAALYNAFPRYDAVALNDPDFDTALTVFNTQTGSVNTGQWTWSYAAGLTGVQGATGLDLSGNPYVVLDGAGNGLAAVPEPGVASLLVLGAVVGCRRRIRR